MSERRRSQLPYYRLRGKVAGRADILKGMNTAALITPGTRRSVYRSDLNFWAVGFPEKRPPSRPTQSLFR
jgi:hypothetical protein